MSKSAGLLCLTYASSKKDVSNSRKFLTNLGFNNIREHISKDVFLGRWCGSPFDRLENFYKSWNSDDKFIFLIRGGSGVDHILGEIDFKNMKSSKKKVYIGYSDITSLLNAIYQYKGNICLHGPMPIKGKLNNKALSCFKDALKFKNYSLLFKDSLNFKNVEGIAVGGNLSRLVEYTPKGIKWNFKKKVLFLEDTSDVSRYRFVNLLISLKENNDVDPVAIVLGRFSKDDLTYIKESLNVLFPGIPIISNVSFGHSSPNFTIPIGAKCKIDFKKKKISFSFRK